MEQGQSCQYNFDSSSCGSRLGLVVSGIVITIEQVASLAKSSSFITINAMSDYYFWMMPCFLQLSCEK